MSESAEALRAWGDIRGAGQTGDPKGRHCASLGHKQDDESGMVYMRARYYAPTTGRFISEDPALKGLNWFAYCGNNPISRVDQSGKSYTNDATANWNYGLFFAALYGFTVGATDAMMKSNIARIVIASGTAMIVAWTLGGDSTGDIGSDLTAFAKKFGLVSGSMIAGLVALTELGGTPMLKGIAAEAVGTIEAYLAVVGMFAALVSLEDSISP